MFRIQLGPKFLLFERLIRKIKKRNREEQNRTEQNRTEQNRTEQKRKEKKKKRKEKKRKEKRKEKELKKEKKDNNFLFVFAVLFWESSIYIYQQDLPFPAKNHAKKGIFEEEVILPPAFPSQKLPPFPFPFLLPPQ